jgi:hypothetical protein
MELPFSRLLKTCAKDLMDDCWPIFEDFFAVDR